MKDMYGRIMIDVEGTSLSQQDRELISNGNVGGIILFSKNFNSFEQISDLVNEIHAIKEKHFTCCRSRGWKGTEVF